MPPGWDDPELFMPTVEELERLIRRRSINRTVTEICQDLAVIPEYCTGHFWHYLTLLLYRFGRAGLIPLLREKFRRHAAYFKEQDRNFGRSTWDWVKMNRDRIHEILGFFIGEGPAATLTATTATTATAIATGPP